jgi:integrase
MLGSADTGTALDATFDRYFQDIGKGRGGDGGHYRRNSKRELERFTEWAAGERGPDKWTGIFPDDVDRAPTFDDLSENVFREYARHLASNRGLKQNTVQTYYAYISAWCGWCVTEGYLDTHFAQRASATAPLPEDNGRKPGDQQAWTSEQRHVLTRYVDDTAYEASERVGEIPDDEPEEKARARYEALRAARDRALVYLISYTAIRIGELVRDASDPRRRGIRWEDVNLNEGSVDVYRKKQSWDSASLPGPVIEPLELYKKRLDTPSDRWPVFPTLHFATVSKQIQEELANRGLDSEEIAARREEYEYDFFLALSENIRLPSITTDGARGTLRRITEESSVEVEHPKHEYLAPHGGRRGMGEVLVRAFGYTVAARYLDNSEEMVRKRYSHIEAGELGDAAAEAIEDVDG